MPNNPRFELLHTANGLPEANLLVSMLESQGFRVIVIEASAGAALGITMGALGRVELYVLPEELEAAQAYLEPILENWSYDWPEDMEETLEEVDEDRLDWAEE